MIGILITYHNEGRLLTECLESVRTQLQGNEIAEILVFDDASTDPAEKHISAGLQVRVLRAPKNVGPGPGRNCLLHESRADYVHFHDADDLFDSAWSARVLGAIVESRPDVVFTDVSFFDTESGRREEPLLRAAGMDQSMDLKRFSIRTGFLPASGTYRKSAVQRIGGYRESLWQAEDWDFHVRLAMSGVTSAFVDAPLVHCRSRQDSRSQKRLEVFVSALNAAELLAAELPQQYLPDLAERVAQFGLILFRMDAAAEARRAFRLAERIGPPTFDEQRPFYRFAGRLFGQERTEIAAAWYRSHFQGLLRRFAAPGGV